MGALVHYDRMRTELALSHALDEVKAIRDKAEALRQYARVAGEGLENQNMMAEIKIRAERRAGELLADREKAKGSQGRIQEHLTGGNTMLPPDDPPTLSDFGISKMQSSRWQQEATVPGEQFERYVAETKAKDQELTSAGLRRLAKKLDRDTREPAPLPTEQYRVLYVDPPWQYSNKGLDYYGHAEWHYPTMSIAELCDMADELKDCTASDAVLFLWVTSPMLEDSFKVIRAWGFQYKTSFVWDKVRHNYGHYNSVRHELLLVCTRGSCTPDVAKLFDSVQSIERTDEHSEKPEQFREIIDTIYTRGERLELFARREIDGWNSWGNEIRTAVGSIHTAQHGGIRHQPVRE